MKNPKYLLLELSRTSYFFFWRETKEVPFLSEQSKKISNPKNESRVFASKVHAQLMRAMMLSLQSQGFLPFCILRGQKGIFCL